MSKTQTQATLVKIRLLHEVVLKEEDGKAKAYEPGSLVSVSEEVATQILKGGAGVVIRPETDEASGS